MTPGELELFARVRGRLEAIAYRMLGSAGDAEDAVQDTFLRWQTADREHIGTPEAWLTTVLTNVCLNQLTSARARRETYVGQWLPEPVPAGDRMLGPAETAEQRESVSIAVLTLLERLSPNERAVYVLREAFGYPHAEIAGMLGLTEANCQQIRHRVRRHVATGRTRVTVDAAAAEKIAENFLRAATSGEIAPLIRLLTDDAVSVADGGGHVPARTTPIVGALAIARFLRSAFRPEAAQRLIGADQGVHLRGRGLERQPPHTAPAGPPPRHHLGRRVDGPAVLNDGQPRNGRGARRPPRPPTVLIARLLHLLHDDPNACATGEAA
ncbi:sigma-70 family RNA polymerase sigma factor [Catenuloplanes indicus]|uniref:RNA polymerase sigma-70 factor (ECF subfamily) n=1 Tax=Catenuloplanes indicus TaxID=137267 RepID=A0AAE4AY02_9ACTN|nr:sigma-70 family RNA polymerase sigma factor [Catenuloplanes indicus]MDQ0364563.1 RNA polymerase sigma-70 factor (ECF subfamily) [Catenuloplanes indicus]